MKSNVVNSDASGEIKNSIRVAFASNTADQLDGHFGSCDRFLVYQVSSSVKQLIDVRYIQNSVLDTKAVADDKTNYRTSLVKDCQLLFVNSIGGPAAAKVIKIGVHPLKYPKIGDVNHYLESLQDVMTKSPPPWLAKILGYDQQSRIRHQKILEDK